MFDDMFIEYRDALIKLDELSLMLGHTLAATRIGWDETTTCEDALGPINQIAKQIGEAMPRSIIATRPPPITRTGMRRVYSIEVSAVADDGAEDDNA